MNRYSHFFCHRGYHGKRIIENTMEAFQKSLDKHLAIELDIYLTTDKQLVVFHDSCLKRLMGVNRKIEDCSFLELSSYSFLESHSKIPLLSDVLRLVHGKVTLLIEIKQCRHYRETCKKLLELLATYSGEVQLQSFDVRVVKYLKRHSSYSVGLLVTNGKKNQTSFYRFLVHRPFFIYHFVHPDFLSCDLRDSFCPIVKKARQEKLPIYLWTIRTKKDLAKAKSYGDYFIAECLDSLFS